MDFLSEAVLKPVLESEKPESVDEARRVKWRVAKAT
jgi:hypothetical protein